jgi:hypothetical protein
VEHAQVLLQARPVLTHAMEWMMMKSARWGKQHDAVRSAVAPTPPEALLDVRLMTGALPENQRLLLVDATHFCARGARDEP